MVTLVLLYSVVSIFLPPEMTQGLYRPILIWGAVLGFGGAFISLLLSKFMAKKFMGVHVVPTNTTDSQQRWLIDTTYRLSKKAGLTTMPEVGIYPSNEINAFATGPSKKNSLVAVSSGLLNNMKQDGVEGVIAHEVAHIVNGDMVTMTLVQGVVNSVVIVLSHIVVMAIDSLMRNNRSGHGGMGFFFRMFIYNIVHSLLALAAMPIVAFVSRIREYRADAGGAKLAGREKMVIGLTELKRFVEGIDRSHPSLATLKISGKRSFARLWSTHPPLDSRIKRLQTGAYTRY